MSDERKIKWVLVTGAGSGIGKAIALHLMEKGYGVVLMGRNGSALEKVANSSKTPHARIAPADICNASAIGNALAKVGVHELYAVVANAGVGGENHYGKDDRWNEILTTNLSGTYYTVNEALPYLRKGQDKDPSRHVLVISSILARLGVPGYSGYCAAKAGLLGLVRSWASEFAQERILVNAICPGWVETQMAMEGLRAFAQASGQPLEAVLKEQMARVPLGKMSQSEEVAALVGFLLSDAQNSITGQTLDINNGALMA